MRERIIKESRQLFAKYGIRSITMDMIADHLGISKRTIYENFKDKNELLKNCIDTAMIEQRRINEEIIMNSSNIVDAIFIFIKNSINTLKQINPVFFFDIQKYYPEIWNKTIQKNDERNFNRIVSLLNRGISEGLFRENINVEIIARLNLEQFKLLSNQEIFPEEKYSMVDIFENIVINFIRGIVTENGLELIDKYNS